MRSRALGLAALAFLVGLCASLAGGARPAFAQQLDAGKPPGQIFSGTCSACHRSPRGLLRSVPPGSLPGFMRQHYTTGSDMAGAMAAYVLANGGTERTAEPPPKREPRQRAKSDAQDVAARASDTKEQQKSRRQKDARKGKAETSRDMEKQEPKPAEADKPAEPEKSATPPAEPPKVVECRIVAPAPPPREPVSQITLPGFPPPVVEPPPAPVTDPPGCDPSAVPDSAKHSEAAPGAGDDAQAPVARAGDDTKAPAEAEAPKLDIMREEAARPQRPAGQKERAE